jgi:hypothetical protein
VRIDCPALEAQQRDALEARLRADVMVRETPSGTLLVLCGAEHGSVQWAPEAGAATVRSFDIGKDHATFVDQLLSAVDLVLPVKATEVVAREAPAPREPEPEPHIEPNVAATSSRLPDDPSGTALVAGAVAEAWDVGGLGVAGGALLGLRARFRGRWTARLYGEAMWLANPPDLYRVSAVGGNATLGAFIDRAADWELGIGFAAATIAIDADEPLRPSRHQRTAVGGLLYGAHHVQIDRVTLSVVPELRFYPSPVVVHQNGSEQLRLPAVTGVLAVTLSYWL